MRQGIALLLLLVLNGCCCQSLDKESYAKVPLTLSEAKKLEKDGATVTVTRMTRSAGGGGGACGHSPLCVLLLPIIVYQAVFPEKWDEVVVTKDGVVTLVGSYETDGALIHAQHLVDGEMRETRNIELKQLGKKVYVDSARLVALPDGGVRREVMSLSSQHDFIGEERKLLSREKDPHRRALAIHEARLLLEDEGFAFARERLAAADEDDETKAEVLKIGCGTPEFDPLIVETQKNPGPWTKVSLVTCLTEEAHDAALLQVVEVACDPKTPKKLMQEIDPLLSRDATYAGGPMLPRLREAQAKCPAGPHRALVALWLTLPVEQKDLDALLVSDLGMEAHTHLRTTEPAHRAALVKLVLENENTEVALGRLVSGKTVLEPALLESLANWYVSPKGLFTTSPRAKVLDLFSFAALAPDGAARTKSARAVFAKAKADPLFESARVAMGERDRMAAAVKGLKSPVYFGSPVSESDLVAYGLKLAGCSQEELVAVTRKEKAMPTCGAPGSVEIP
jgi:hypothetical protein